MLDYVYLFVYGVPVLYLGTKLLGYLITSITSFNEARRFVASSPLPGVTVCTFPTSLVVPTGAQRKQHYCPSHVPTVKATQRHFVFNPD